MKEWKHITLEQRKSISSGISHNYKVKDIAEVLSLDPTSISKEVKRNRDSITVGLNSTSCKRTQRWPYVCDAWNKKYQNCPFTKYKYVAEKAQKKADINLINSRKGIDISSEELMERFVRGDRSRHTEGSGLGLSIAKSLTELQNGDFALTVDGDFFKVMMSFQAI